jgi:hypothetical protein
MDDLVVRFPQGGRHDAKSYLNSCLKVERGKLPIYIGGHVLGVVWVIGKADYIAGFKAKMMVARTGRLFPVTNIRTPLQ